MSVAETDSKLTEPVLEDDERRIRKSLRESRFACEEPNNAAEEPTDRTRKFAKMLL